MQLSKSNVSFNEDHVYYTATYINPSDHTVAVPATIAETRAQTLIERPSEYNVAVAIMTISSTNVPLLFTSSDMSTWSITITYTSGGTTTTYTTFVLWWGPTGNDYVFYYRDICQAINTALANSITNINNGHSTTYGNPIMTYIPGSSQFALLFPGTDSAAWTSGFPNTTLKLYFNWRLYQKFLNFWSRTISYNDPGQQDVQIYVQNFISNIVSYSNVTTGTTNYIQMNQEINTNNFNPLESITLASNTIPVTQDQVSLSFASGNNKAATNGLAIGNPILTNFYPVLSSYQTPQSTLAFEYIPNIYRQIPMISDAPLATINITASLLLADGTTKTYMLAPGDSMDIKLVFIKKGLTD